MLQYLKAENLKCKRTFVKKLVFIAPLIMILLSCISGIYLVQNGYNWWYTLLFPGFITLAAALANQVEEKKLRYRSMFALPVSLQKIWISKIFLIAVYTSVASVFHFVGIFLGKSLLNPESAIATGQMIAATLILIVTSLWQIPFCLFLAKKLGFMATILINLGAGTMFNIFAAEKSFWWVCPYSWATRLMCPVLGILPNGILAEKGDTLQNPVVIPVGIVLSVALFIFLIAFTAKWFQNQEVK